MSWILTIIIGGVIGWLASIIMKTNAQMGLSANVLVGIVGSFLGVWIGSLLGITAGGLIGFLLGIGGAVLLIFILRKAGLFGRSATV